MQRFKFRTQEVIDLTALRIEGARIVLQSVDESYAEDMFKEFTSEMTRYMCLKTPEKIEEILSFISESLEGMRAGRDLLLVITKKDSGEFLGCCGFHGRDNPDTPEPGIWIKKSEHGNKYGREAVRMRLRVRQARVGGLVVGCRSRRCRVAGLYGARMRAGTHVSCAPLLVCRRRAYAARLEPHSKAERIASRCAGPSRCAPSHRQP